MKYKYIVAWGQYMGSYRHYIDDQVALARQDNAPENAIYKDRDGGWQTVDNMRNLELRKYIIDLAQSLG